uniref:60s ribosomal protein L12 n=1 Tax=Pfiesteria piscicida TaxID=71001 RepID=E8Z6F5_PFIPI|nr:60s ribosomal protein L12 [Pfiesteria piscicida]|mmetsp:Transcript_17759/g.36424  ORF Transcript_17759/g.36424 Transcript_17759/m.36424 type:complete len:148 (+) Transcript_17759:858-1301(+)
MPPKFDSTAVNIIFIRTIGGEIGAVSSLAPKLGPLGLAPKKIGEQLSKATTKWEGLKVICKLIVRNRQAEVEVVPSSSVLILKALSEPKRDRKKIKNVVHNGQLAFIDIIKIAKMMKNKSCSIDLKGGINEILGTAKSIGCIINKNN